MNPDLQELSLEKPAKAGEVLPEIVRRVKERAGI